MAADITLPPDSVHPAPPSCSGRKFSYLSMALSSGSVPGVCFQGAVKPTRLSPEFQVSATELLNLSFNSFYRFSFSTEMLHPFYPSVPLFL